ncbi:MAG: hypothetical protein ACREXT_15295 [Gammaproteobacteria bacterium]
MANASNILRAAAAGVLMAAISVPALAQQTGSPAKITYNAKTGKYCTKLQFTGTRLAKSLCLTRAQWAEEGVIIPQNAETEMAKK